jgi:DNA-binding response OmpR family regulator
MSESGGAPRATKTVVVIDDTEFIRLLLQRLLERAGYAFLGAATGTDGLSLLARVTPDLVLLDVQMPGMDGYETCRKLRRIPHLEAVPVVFLTARSTAEDTREASDAGGDDFIVKPFDPVDLLGRVQHWMARKR